MLVLGASLTVLVPSRPVAEALRAKAEAIASRASSVPVRMGRLQLTAFPPGVVLEDVEVGAAAGTTGERPALHVVASRVRLCPHVLSLWHRRLVLAELEVDGAQVEASAPAASNARTPSPADGNALAAGEALRQRLALPMDVHRATVHAASITLHLPQGRLEIGEVVLQANRPRIGRRIATLQAPEARFVPAAGGVGAAPEVPLTLTLALELRGPWTNPRQLRVTDGHLAAPKLGATLAIEAAVAGAGGRPETPLEGTLRLAADAWPLTQNLAPNARAEGRLKLEARLGGPWKAPEASLALVAEKLRRLPLPAQGAPASPNANAPAGPAAQTGGGATVAASGRLSSAGFTLAHLAVAPGPGGATDGGLTAAGALDFAPGLPLRLQTFWHGTRASVVGALLGAQAGPLELGLRGEATVRGTCSPPRATVAVQLGVEDFRLAAGPARPASPATSPAAQAPPTDTKPAAVVLAMDAVGVTGTLQLAPDRLGLEGVQLHRRGASVDVEGALARGAAGAPPELTLQVWAGGLPLQALGPIAGLAYAGVASFGGTLRGPWTRPEVEAALRVDGLRVGPVGFGDAEGVLHFIAPTLQLLRFDAQRGGGRLRGEGAIRFAAGHNTVTADAQLADWDAADVLADFGAPAAVSDALDARLWGAIDLHGALDRPAGGFALRSPQLGVGAVHLGAAELRGTLAAGDALLEADLITQPPTGTLALHVGIHDAHKPVARRAAAGAARPGGQRLHVIAQADRLPLGRLLAADASEATPTTPGVQGELTLRLDAEGALDGLPTSLVGTMMAEVAHLQLRGAAIGGAHLLARAENGHAAVDLRLLRGAAHLAADVKLAAPWPTTARLELDAVDAAVLRPWLPGSAALDQARAQLSGSAALHGTLDAVEQMQGSLTVRAIELGYRGTTLKLRAPVTLQLAHGRLLLPALQLADKEATVGLHGTLPLQHGELDLRCDAGGDLRGLRGLLPGVLDAQGPLRLDLHVRGPWGRPQLLGELTLRGAQLRLADARGQLLEEVELRALFSGRAVAITTARARLGRGRMRLSGEVNFAGQPAVSGVAGAAAAPTSGELGLRLQLDRVPLALGPDLSATVTGGLELGGRLDAPLLRGELRVASLRYTARLDLDALVPRRAAPPLRAPISSLGRPVQLAIKLRAPGDLIISSQVLEAELAADLLVTGTTERVGLLGSVSPLWARARYNNNLFTLTHATVDFTDEYRISPNYSVQAHTRACQMEADVLVQGDVDGFTVQPTGRDEHGTVDPQDLMTCLNFGLRLSDFAGNRGRTASMGEALTGSIDALWSVSGLDDKVRNLLPIRVDELRLTSGWSSLSRRTTARVLVGKELGHGVGLRYSRSLDEYNDQAFSLEYRLQQRATLQANWLSALNVPVGDFGVDVRLHWELR